MSKIVRVSSILNKYAISKIYARSNRYNYGHKFSEIIVDIQTFTNDSFSHLGFKELLISLLKNGWKRQ